MNCGTKSGVFYTVFLLLTFLVSTPLMAADETKVVESETGFYYTIQKGDTLWDLSKQFSDSPWLWPELWKENDQISNPHWIFPGERIRLYRKAGTQIITQPEPSQPVAVEPAAEPPVRKTKKMAKTPFFVYPSIDRVGFIRNPPVTPTGTIFEVRDNKDMISEGDIVYIRPTDDEAAKRLIPGSRHTLFKYMPPTDERDSAKIIGTQHYILGIVELTKKEPDMMIGRIVKSFRTIRVGDMLMPYDPRSERIELKASTPGIDGRIINSEEHTALTGDYVLAFIDKGLADNIEVGQEYNIYTRQKTVLEAGEIKKKRLPPTDFGALLVLRTEQTTSTVMITRTSASISAGDRFRTPVK